MEYLTRTEIYAKIYPQYMEWVDRVSEECEWKTHFTPEEIVEKICALMLDNYEITPKDETNIR